MLDKLPPVVEVDKTVVVAGGSDGRNEDEEGGRMTASEEAYTKVAAGFSDNGKEIG